MHALRTYWGYIRGYLPHARRVILRSDVKKANRMLAHGRPPTRKTCSLPRAHVNRRARSAGRRMGWVKIAQAGAGGGGARTNTQEDQPTGAFSAYTIRASEWAAASALTAWGVQACYLRVAVTRDARSGGAGRLGGRAYRQFRAPPCRAARPSNTLTAEFFFQSCATGRRKPCLCKS